MKTPGSKAHAALLRRLNVPPGQHGPKGRRRKPSDYALQLREKQKARRLYGVLEKQFRTYFAEALKDKGNTGEKLLQQLEQRLDNIIYRLGLAPTRAAARQLVAHGHVLVNNKKVSFPSYLVQPEDVMTLKQEMSQRTISAKIISKVESQKGVDNIDAIIDASDGIMIARGDLGVEVPLEQVTHIQKEIIKKCRSKCKPVILATQMLESMMDRPRPTRAEAADVANAVYDGTDAVMLSGESATGKYPVKAVEVMRKILKYNEGRTHSLDISIIKAVDYTQSIVSAAMNILNTEKFHEIHKIIVFTETGYTARVLSSFRPNIPVVALSNNLNTVESLSLNYGIVSFYYDFPEGFFSIPAELSIDLKKRGIVKENETVIILHGSKWRDPGKTNALLITRI